MRALLLTVALCVPALAQTQNFEVKKVPPPDEATLAKIKAKTEELGKVIDALPKTTNPTHLAQVKIFHKAGVWIVRHNEWFNANSGKQTLDILDAGLARAKALAEGKTPWLDARNKPIALGYRSSIDDSVQPYSIRYPENFDPKKKYRLDVVLHGRNGSLTEVSFLNGKEFAKPGKGTDYFVLEVYGRGNNAYRWAGETDVIDAAEEGISMVKKSFNGQLVLRGFSMGGAGTWHLGLRHSFFSVMSPGAGFSDTKTYIKGFPQQPDYIDKCLHIYDAVDYAENVFNIPIVAYSGGKDAQKAAADNIENLLKKFKEPHSFTHIIAPDLAHSQPPEWFAKVDEQMRKHLTKDRSEYPERVRFVTYTTRYGRCQWLQVNGLDEHYRKAVIDAKYDKSGYSITSDNVRIIHIITPPDSKKDTWDVMIDGQKLSVKNEKTLVLHKINGKWVDLGVRTINNDKQHGEQGPIDDAFLSRFEIIPPSGKALNNSTEIYAEASQKDFTQLWDKYFRGEVRIGKGIEDKEYWIQNRILFGDPGSNPSIAKVLPKLPIKWTKDELVMNGKTYDAKTHVPIMIYPYIRGYVVINSGHTFREDALKGTNALLYPRLGDWAVVKPKPTKDDPAAYEVIDAGIFDENWQFKKK